MGQGFWIEGFDIDYVKESISFRAREPVAGALVRRRAEAMSKAVAVKNVVWLGGQEWATCRTPGQAARVAEDMNAVDALERRLREEQDECRRAERECAALRAQVSLDTLERRMSNLLDTVDNPATNPEGAPGSLHRRAWDLGRRLREAESGMREAQRCSVKVVDGERVEHHGPGCSYPSSARRPTEHTHTHNCAIHSGYGCDCC